MKKLLLIVLLAGAPASAQDIEIGYPVFTQKRISIGYPVMGDIVFTRGAPPNSPSWD